MAGGRCHPTAQYSVWISHAVDVIIVVTTGLLEAKRGGNDHAVSYARVIVVDMFAVVVVCAPYSLICGSDSGPTPCSRRVL